MYRARPRCEIPAVHSDRAAHSECEVSTRIGDCVIRRRQGDDYGTHLRMDVAEDKRDARLVELDKSRGSALIEPKVETLALEE